MTQQVLALKWRPRTFNEVIGQPHVVQALSNGLDNDRLHHAFLFTGTRGVGKTTLARIFAKSLNCEKGVSSNPCGECSICREVDEGRFVDLIEIDAASRTRVEDTREILDNVQYAPTRGRYKIYLIDEVHMLSNSSFNALLKTLEEPPSHVKFLLATTDPQKLPVTVLSRCLRFQLKRIQDQEISGQLETILTSEGIPFELDALKLIAKAGDGSMRDALSLLDQAIAYSGQNVQFKPTHEMLGLIDTQYLNHILEALATKESAQLLVALSLLKSHGLDYYRFLEDLIDAFHLLTMIQLSPEMGEKESPEMNALAAKFSPEDLQLFYQIALNGRKDLHNHPNSEVGFEMTLLRMVLFAPSAPVGVVEAQKKSLLAVSSHLQTTTPSESRSTISQEEGALNNDLGKAALSVSEKNDEPRIASNTIITPSVNHSLAINTEDPLVEREEHFIADKVDLPWEEEVKEAVNTTNDKSFVESESVTPEPPVFEITEAEDSMQATVSESLEVKPLEMMPPKMASSEQESSESEDFEKETAALSSVDLESDSVSTDSMAKDLEASDNVLKSISEADRAPFTHFEPENDNSALEREIPEEFVISDEASNRVEQNHPINFNNKDILPTHLEDAQPTSSLLNNNEEWLSLVAGLTLESVLSGIAHSLVFKSFDGLNLVLERPLSVKDFKVDEAEMRLAMAISAKIGVKVNCRIEYVETLDVENLHERTERLDEERLQQALNSFKQDEVVQYMEQELGAVLLTKTLKPVDEG